MWSVQDGEVERGGQKWTRTFPLPLPLMIAASIPAGKSADTPFRILFLRSPPPSTSSLGLGELGLERVDKRSSNFYFNLE